MAPHSPTINLEPGALGDAISESLAPLESLAGSNPGIQPYVKAYLSKFIFLFAREIQCLFGRNPTGDEMRFCCTEWVKVARRRPGLADVSLSEILGIACNAVKKIKKPKGEKSREKRVLELAAKLKPSRQLQQLYPDEERAWRLGAFCRAANVINRPEPFPLSARYIGDYLGCSRMTAWRLIETFVLDGLLKRVSIGKYLHGASKYRWLGCDV